jgi:hypothetical protein
MLGVEHAASHNAITPATANDATILRITVHPSLADPPGGRGIIIRIPLLTNSWLWGLGNGVAS